MLSPLAVAVQGIGFGPRLVAVQGLWGAEQPAQPWAPPFGGYDVAALREQFDRMRRRDKGRPDDQAGPRPLMPAQAAAARAARARDDEAALLLILAAIDDDDF